MNQEKVNTQLQEIDELRLQQAELTAKLKCSLAATLLWGDAFKYGGCSIVLTGNASSLDRMGLRLNNYVKVKEFLLADVPPMLALRHLVAHYDKLPGCQKPDFDRNVMKPYQKLWPEFEYDGAMNVARFLLQQLKEIEQCR